MHKISTSFFVALSGFFLGASSLYATEVEVSIAPLWWQYEESSEQRAGFGTTPLSSLARGYAIESTVAVKYDLDERWLSRLSFEVLMPLNRATERWTLPGNIQTNQLDITQLETRSDLIYRFDRLAVGVWASYQWHQQHRRNFAAIVSSGHPMTGLVKETVQTAWAGLFLQSTFWNSGLTTIVDVALPVWVHTTNSSISGVFNRRRGFRFATEAAWTTPLNLESATLSTNLSYQYRELGDDLKTTALWPKNRWQTLSLGAKLIW